MSRVDPKEFRRIERLTWEDVFNLWRNNEIHLPHWRRYYKTKGHKSWEEFRRPVGKTLKLDGRAWYIYEITNPLKTVPKLLGGPYKEWRNYIPSYGKRRIPPFSHIARYPVIKDHKTINQIRRKFPKDVVLIGLATEDGITIIEGMHRCCAMALAAKRGENPDTKVTIALARYSMKKLLAIMNKRHKTKKSKSQ